MSRNKKILIGVGVVVVLGAVAFANVKFKRQDGIDGQRRRRSRSGDLAGDRVGVGKIQPKRLVNISADTMGRVTNLAVEEGQRVTEGAVPAADRSAQPDERVRPDRGVARAPHGRRWSSCASRSRARRRALEAGAGRLRAAAAAVEGGLTTRETLDNAENQLKMRQADAELARNSRSRRSGCA